MLGGEDATGSGAEVATMRVISLLGAAIIGLVGGGVWVQPASAATSARPSFLIAGETFCLDEVEFDRFAQTGQLPMHAQDSCTVMRNVTRVVVMGGGPG